MTNLQIECVEQQRTLVVRLQGELDMAGAEQFRHDVDKFLAGGDVTHLCVDLTGLTFVDSSGIGALLGRYRQLAAHGGTMSLVRAAAPVRGLLELSGVLRVIPLYDTEQQAGLGA